MALDEHRLPAWLDRALSDPGSVFPDPEAVAESADLSLEEKVRVLRSWEYDAAELEVAEEEGMPGPRNGLLQRIVLVLAGLTGGRDTDWVAPTKQHGLID
jgi:hypothetical protein